jgi:hypothetical protein
VKRRLREILETDRPAAITETVWHDLVARLAPVSESYLRDLLRATGLPFEQPWAGVSQHTFEDLEHSLRAMGDVYARAMGAGDGDRARRARRQVIAARDRALFLSRNPRSGAQLRARKQEMAQWMLVWLEDPAMFPAWVDARKRAAPPEA